MPDFELKKQQLEARRSELADQMQAHANMSTQAKKLLAAIDRVDIQLTLIHRFAVPGAMSMRNYAAELVHQELAQLRRVCHYLHRTRRCSCTSSCRLIAALLKS